MTIEYLYLDKPNKILSLEFSLKAIKTLKVTGACFCNMISPKVDLSSFILKHFLLFLLEIYSFTLFKEGNFHHGNEVCRVQI